MKKILYMHSGSGNHGCEALLRTTATLLGGPQDVELWSFAGEEDVKYGASAFVERIYASEEIKRFSPAYFEALFKRVLLKKPDATLETFMKVLFKNKVAVAIGGDIYCYPWSAKQSVDLNKTIRCHCAKSVLWGCSIEKDAVTPEVAEDLAGYDLITARESITYELLKKINPNTQLVADPAFLLETTYKPLPDGFAEGNTVGVNVSPMIMDYSKDGQLVLENYAQMLQYLLDNTDMNIALIPHVIWNMTDDREPLKELYKRFQSTNRVCLIEDADATVLKGYIARCRFFIGARTHATIAAYSSCVPTLVVGYSVKSRGIAKDLFGDGENYVLPVQSLVKDGQLVEAVKTLIKDESAIKKALENIMPKYKERAKKGKEFFDIL